MPVQYTAIYSALKLENFVGKNDNFDMFAQNINCGYTSEAQVPMDYVLDKNDKFKVAYP